MEQGARNNGADVMFALCSFTNCKQPLCFFMFSLCASVYVCVYLCFEHCNTLDPGPPQHQQARLLVHGHCVPSPACKMVQRSCFPLFRPTLSSIVCQNNGGSVRPLLPLLLMLAMAMQWYYLASMFSSHILQSQFSLPKPKCNAK